MIINLKKIKEYIDTALDRKADKVHTHSQYLTDHQDISGKEDKTNKSNSISSDTGSTTKYPTIKAVEDYAQPKGNYSVTVTKLSNATTGYIATYEVKQGNVSLGKIDIPKDYLIKSGSVKSVTTANNPVNGYAVGDKYIDFIVNTKDSSGTDEHIYINVKDLIDTYEPVTVSSDGLMTAEDKIKLNGIAEEANKYVHPSGTAKTGNPNGNKTPGFGDTFTVTQFTSNNTGHISGATDRTVKIPNTEATTSKAGLMSANDKTKLNGVATGATNNTVENVLTSDSTTNALSAKQGKELKAQIDGIVAGTIATDHNHDSRYYTEYEVDTKLNGKAASVHTHDYDEINLQNVSGNIDYNNYKTQGLYSIWYADQQGNTNKPSSSGGLLKVEEIPNGYAQTFYCYGTNSNQIFYRTYYNPTTTWNGWIRIDGQDKANSSHTHPDTQITWNGSALAGSVSPIDMAMYEEFNANRLAYLSGNNITIEYSTNGGSTWTDYGATAQQKQNLVTLSETFNNGKNSTTDYTKNQLRITIDAGTIDSTHGAQVYLKTRKLMLYYCECNASNTKVKIEKAQYTSDTSFATIGTYDVKGWTGWNSIPIDITFGGYANQGNSGQTKKLRLTFTQTGGTGNGSIKKIRLFGETCWTAPSNLANNGHMYTYNENQDVTFPAKIIKSGGTSSQLLLANGDTKATGDFATSGHTHTTSNITNFPTSMTPTAHATNSTTYGGGTSSNYGHVKVSDNYTSSAGNASQSVAASSAAVKSVYDVANGKTVTLTKLDTATSGYIATYEIKQGTTSLGKIDIPKDFLVKSGSVKSVTTANSPVSGYVVGDKYIDFIINTKDNSGTDDHVYINVKDLIDTYTAGTGLNLSSNAFSVKYGTAAGTACQGNDSRLSDSRVPKFTDIGASSSNEKDLNTYRTGGFYYIGSNANSKYIDHCPLPKANNVSFFLLVETWGASNNNYVKQTLTYYTTNKTYTRTKTGNSDANTNWNPWKLISTSTEYIVGTQTTSTNIWTGKANDISSLQSGQVIYYKLPYASTNADVTLNLTLADGTTTGAKNVWFWNGSRVRQQYGVNSIIGLIYNGSEWWVINPSSNNNNNSLLYGGVRAKAGSTAIAANTLIGAKKDGLYYKLTSGMVLDIKYPIVYATGAIAANAISTAIYHTHWNASTSNNGFTSWTVPNMIYLEGDSYSKGQFKISSTIMTQTPTNGKYYIALGEAETANQIKLRTLNMRVYHYEDDEFVPVTDKTEYGGRNLLSETQAFTSGTNGALTGDAYKGCAVRRYNNTSGTTYVDCSWSNMPAIGDFNAGDFFTLSFWAKGTGSVICYSYGNSGYMTTKPVNASDGAVYSGYGDGNCRFTLTEDWKRYFVTWKFNGTSTATNVNKILLIRTTKGSDSYIAGPKFERGNIAHDWSPNPDDKVNTTDSRLTNARTPTSHTNTGNSATYGQASTSVWGHTKLNSATNSSDETTAATPKAVKAAYDLANGKAASNHVHGWINNDGTIGGTNDKSKAVITNGEGKVATGTIDTSRLSDSAITTAKIADYAVDFRKTLEFGATGGEATAGYVKVMQITIGGAWKDMPITFDIFSRGKKVSHVTLRFANSSGSDPDVSLFEYTGQENNIYIVKNTTSKWDIVVNKPANDKITIKNINQPHNYVANGVSFSALNTLLSAAPTLASTDKKATYVNYAAASHTHSNYLTSHNPIDTALSTTSTNAVQNKVINTALSGKAPNSHAVNASTYGLGTTGVYGHTKVIQNLTTSDGNGLALGAGQGKELKTQIDNNRNEAQNITFFFRDLALYFDVPYYYRSYTNNEDITDLLKYSSAPKAELSVQSTGLKINSSQSSTEKQFYFPVVNPTYIKFTYVGGTLQGWMLKAPQASSSICYGSIVNSSRSISMGGSTTTLPSDTLTSGDIIEIQINPNGNLTVSRNGTAMVSKAVSTHFDGIPEYYFGFYTNYNRNLVIKYIKIQ